MKYIKPFNLIKESNLTTAERIEEFCRNSLSYLIDEGASFEIEPNYNFYSDDYTLEEPSDVYVAVFNFSKRWEELTYDVIPFFELLNIYYELETFKGHKNRNIGFQVVEQTFTGYKLLYPYYMLEGLLDEDLKTTEVSVKKGAHHSQQDEYIMNNNTIITKFFFYIKLDTIHETY